MKVHAASVNDDDAPMVKGKPFLVRLIPGGLLKPKTRIPGGDVAGRIEAVGRHVEQFQPGDEVFGDIGGCGFGAWAEYVAAPEDALVLKPASTTGQKVLINGASGGVGTFAVQIAKSFGAEVTGVCSTPNLDLVRSIGADQVIDYTREDFTKSGQRYDLVFDIAGNRSVSDNMRVLRPKGVYVSCAISVVALLLGPLISMFGSKKVVQLSHRPNDKDLILVNELLESGKVVPVVDRQYPLSEVAEAVRYYGEERPQGKVAITVDHNNT